MYPVVGVVLYLPTWLGHLKDIITWKALTEKSNNFVPIPDVNWPYFLVVP